MQSTNELVPIVIQKRGDGLNDVFLRRNITSHTETDENGSAQTIWEAEELQIVSSDEPEVIKNSVAEIWRQHDEKAVSKDELIARIQELELGIAELGTIVAGGM